jgi:hypothetical protein
MDFGTLLHTAQKNEKVGKKEVILVIINFSQLKYSGILVFNCLCFGKCKRLLILPLILGC